MQVELAAEGKWGALGVRDSGIGIPEEDLPNIFSRFHRGRNAAETPGSGLGLAIVKAVVEGHQERIALLSNPQGTEVQLLFPLN